MDAAGMFWWVLAAAGVGLVVVIVGALVSIIALSVVDQWKRKAIERSAYAAELGKTATPIFGRRDS